MCDHFTGGFLPSQQEAEYSFSGFIPTNKQTNKQNMIARGCMPAHEHFELFLQTSGSAIIGEQRPGTVS